MRTSSPPPLWHYLTTAWCPLPADLARAWWFALAHSTWSQAVSWRGQFLAFAQQDGLMTSDVVADFLAEIATPAHLIALVEQLMHEQRLLRRDGRQIEERLLARTDTQAVALPGSVHITAVIRSWPHAQRTDHKKDTILRICSEAFSLRNKSFS